MVLPGCLYESAVEVGGDGRGRVGPPLTLHHVHFDKLLVPGKRQIYLSFRVLDPVSAGSDLGLLFRENRIRKFY